jgi:hypothetical protein
VIGRHEDVEVDVDGRPRLRVVRQRQRPTEGVGHGDERSVDREDALG